MGVLRFCLTLIDTIYKERYNIKVGVELGEFVREEMVSYKLIY
jgi:hypothetical protein